jgi:hypothetical protein
MVLLYDWDKADVQNSGKKIFEHKICVWFSVQYINFFIVRTGQREVVKNVKKPSCKVPVILLRF